MNKNLIIALNAIEQKHDLELALIDDLKKLNAVSLKESKSLTTAMDKAKLAISDAKAFNRNYAIALNNSIKVVDQAKVKAKELGLELPTDVVKIETDTRTALSNFETVQKNLLSAEKLI